MASAVAIAAVAMVVSVAACSHHHISQHMHVLAVRLTWGPELSNHQPLPAAYPFKQNQLKLQASGVKIIP